MEVIFKCQPEKSAKTESSPLPPWQLDLSATPASVKKTSTHKATIVAETTTEAMLPAEKPIYTEYDVDEEFIQFRQEEDVDISENYENEEVDGFPSDSCPPITERNLFWNWTKSGKEAIQVCPPGSSGFARWSCNPDGHWSSEYPNLGDCQSHWLRRLKADSGSISYLSSKLVDYTGSTTLYGGDLHTIIRMLQVLPERLSEELSNYQSQRDIEHEASVLKERVTKIASDLLDQSQLLAWQDLNADKRANLASSLFTSVSESNLLLAEVLNREKLVRVTTDNIAIDMRVRGSRHVEEQVMTDATSDALMVLTRDSLLEASSNGAVRLAFFEMSGLENILPGLDGHFINSQVVGAAIAGDTQARLSRPIFFSLQHKVRSEAKQPICAAWNIRAAKWSSEGCRVIKTSPERTSCECDALAHYAVLTKVGNDDIPMASNLDVDDDDGLATNLILASLCVLISLTILCLSIGLIYAKKKKTLYCGNSATSDGFYPPLAASASPSLASQYRDSRIFGRRDVMSSDEHASSRQVGPSIIFQGNIAEPQKAVPYNHQQLYGHIYSEIDPAYGLTKLLESETSSESCCSSSDDDGIRHSSHHRRFSSPQQPLILGATAAAPPPPPPPPPPVAITLQDGDQFVRLRLEDPYTSAEIQRQQDLCFRV